jgi:hypothetical protein
MLKWDAEFQVWHYNGHFWNSLMEKPAVLKGVIASTGEYSCTIIELVEHFLIPLNSII